MQIVVSPLIVMACKKYVRLGRVARSYTKIIGVPNGTFAYTYTSRLWPPYGSPLSHKPSLAPVRFVVC